MGEENEPSSVGGLSEEAGSDGPSAKGKKVPQSSDGFRASGEIIRAFALVCGLVFLL